MLKRDKKLIFFLFTFPLIVLLTIEFINFNSILLLKDWIYNKYYIFIAEYVFLFLFFNSLLLFNKFIYFIIGFSSTCIMLLLSMINKVKYEFRGEPLYPWDYLLLKEATTIVGNVISNKNIIVIILLIIIIFLIYYVIYKKYQNFEKKLLKKISIVSTVSLLIYITFIVNVAEGNEERLLLTTYNSTGFIYGLYYNYQSSLSMKINKEYNENKIKNILEDLNEDSSEIENTTKPNVVVIMSEAFWDTSKLKEIKLNKDPLEYFHQLQTQTTSGELIVPVYGGGTANTEFEVLTGLSTKYLPPGSAPYTSHITGPLESLASTFKQNGYQSIAAHSYVNWYYNRSFIYKNLGFDKYISMEFLGDGQQIGPWLDDHDLFATIVEELNKTELPTFIFAVTMLNHGGYAEDRFDKYTFEVNGNLSSESESILRTYVETQSTVDKSLKFLIEELEKIEKPTILVYFGDHLPMLGEDYLVYRETNYFLEQDDNYYEYLDMYSVPMIIWKNHEEYKKEDIFISSNFLGNFILKESGIDGNNVFKHNEKMLNEGINIIPDRRFYKDVDLNSNTRLDILKDSQLLQYDVLLGKSYSSDKKSVISPNYLLGQGQIKVLGTTPPEINKGELFNDYLGESIIGIYGENFAPINPYFISGTHIYINGERQDTGFANKNYISCIVPKKYYQSSGEIEIQVKVVDTKGNIISESNIVKVPIK